MKNECLRLVRKIGKIEEVHENLPDASTPVDEKLIQIQLEDRISAAIARLETSYRSVILLRDVEGLSAPEVAKRLGVSVEAVKSRLHRARSAVRAEVAPHVVS